MLLSTASLYLISPMLSWMNVETEFAILPSTRIGSLRFSSICTDQNMTSIRCRAILCSGVSALSDNAALLLRGIIIICMYVCARVLEPLCGKKGLHVMHG